MRVIERACLVGAWAVVMMSAACQVALSTETSAAADDGTCEIAADPAGDNAKCDDARRTDESNLGFTCLAQGVEISATNFIEASQNCAAWLMRSNKVEITADFSTKVCGTCPDLSSGCQIAHPYKEDGTLGDGYVVGDAWVERGDDGTYLCGKCLSADEPDQKILILFRCTRCVASDC